MENAAIEPAALPRLQSTSGGFSDTELNELAVNPTSSPLSVRAVTMVTPVANMPSEARNSRAEKSGARACRTGGRAEDMVNVDPERAAMKA
ncbi:hypothetical protein D9M69_528550 [compost metagenome]